MGSDVSTPTVETPADDAAAPAEATAVQAPADQPTEGGLRTQLLPFGAFAGWVAGAALVGAAVSHAPLLSVRAGIELVLGLVLFLGATAVHLLGPAVREAKPAQLMPVLLPVVPLALGAGLLAGGIQGFTGFSGRPLVLVPLGLALCFAGFALRARPAGGAAGEPVDPAKKRDAMIDLGLALAGIAIFGYLAISHFDLLGSEAGAETSVSVSDEAEEEAAAEEEEAAAEEEEAAAEDEAEEEVAAEDEEEAAEEEHAEEEH